MNHKDARRPQFRRASFRSRERSSLKAARADTHPSYFATRNTVPHPLTLKLLVSVRPADR